MKVIVGLGNPGKEYEKTLHNAGYLVLDALCSFIDKGEAFVYPFSGKRTRLYEKIETMVAGREHEKIVLLKPTTFMNESGIAVKEYLKHTKKAINLAESLWIIHDDGDIRIGQVRVGVGKRAAGHRGVVSIMQTLGIADCVRFRVGIRHEGDTRRTETFVLKKPRKEDQKQFEVAIIKTAQGILSALEEGIPKAQMFLHKKNNG